MNDHEITQVRSTSHHIRRVGEYLCKIAHKLVQRSIDHDSSKFCQQEWPGFLRATEQLRKLTYGSPEYEASRAELGPTLEHHYAHNRHHPEHFIKWVCNGCFTEYQAIQIPHHCWSCGYTQMQKETDISQMTLLDLTEMLCDWLAASERHDDGDIFKSIELNQKRFGYSDEMKAILLNTLRQDIL